MNDLLKTNRCPHDIAEKLDIPLAKARKMVMDCNFELEGWGRPGLQKHIISRKRSTASWPQHHRERIHQFQKLHDQGRINICQGKDGDFCILYALPNRVQISRDPYFFVERGY